MEIRKEHRKTLTIYVDNKGEVIVKAPLYLTLKKINKFVESKQSWILKQQEKIKNNHSFIMEFDFKNNLYLNSEAKAWDEVLGKDKRKTKRSVYNDLIDIFIKNINKTVGLIEKGIIIKPCNSKRIWGSCSAKKIIKINWKIIILPKIIQNYIICHELCHVYEMNHSRSFWEKVQSLCPEYKEIRKSLKKYNFLLETDVF